MRNRNAASRPLGILRCNIRAIGMTLLAVLALVAPALRSTGGASAIAQPPPPPIPPLPAPTAPPGNPITPEKAVLGKILFWDEQLSSDNSVACGTCHRPEFGGGDPRLVRTPGFDGIPGNADDVFGSPGVVFADENDDYQPHPDFDFDPQVTGRNTPSFIGAQYFTELFWDGRATDDFIDPETGAPSLATNAALESQAVGPPLSDVEMAHMDRDWPEILAKLADVRPLAIASDLPPDVATAIAAHPDYPSLFEDAFGDTDITAARVAMALGTYQRTLVPNQTPWDAFNDGDGGALTPNQRMGLGVFRGPGRCVLCHSTALFSNDDFHALGVRPPAEDLGRFEVTGDPADRGRFKTASLRNVGLRPRFMHNGGFATLMGVVNFYNGGGGAPENRDPLLIPLGLSPAERNALVDFLDNGLTDPRVAAQLPPFDRPTLHSELGGANPTSIGTGTAGSAGIVPTALTIAPPISANPDFKLGIHGALGGAKAVLAISNNPASPGTEVNGVPVFVALDSSLRKIKTTLEGVGAGEGYATFQKGIPDSPGLIGRDFFGQWFVKDGGASGNLAATAGFRLEIE